MTLTKSFRNLLLLTALSFFTSACTPNNPVALSLLNSLTTPAPTPSAACGNANTVFIMGGIVRSNTMTAGSVVGSNYICFLNAYTELGGLPSPATITSVTLIPAGGAPVSINTSSGLGVSNMGTGWTYQPGLSYTMNCTVDGYSYSASVVAPGNASIPSLVSPGPITWSYCPLAGELLVGPSGATPTTFLSISSGSVNEASSSAFTAPGPYEILLILANQSGFCTAGVPKIFESEDIYYDNDPN